LSESPQPLYAATSGGSLVEAAAAEEYVFSPIVRLSIDF